MTRKTVGKVAIVLAMMMGQAVCADEIDLTGTWQSNADCGDGITTVAGWKFTEIPATGDVDFEFLVPCLTAFLDGAIREYAACTIDPDPVPGKVAGTSLSIPEEGVLTATFELAAPYVSPFCLDGVWAKTVLDQAIVGATITDDGMGTGTRIDGSISLFGGASINVLDELCQPPFGPGPGCTFVALRSGVSIGTAQGVAPLPKAAITFTNVSAPGVANVTPLTVPDGALPANFQVSDLPLYFDVTTTATISGSIEVCLPYPDDDSDGFVDGTTPPVDETTLRLLHEEGGVFVDRTVGIDTVVDVICAETESLSQFVFGASTVTCGNGVVDGGEDCDQGAGANGAQSSCCTTSCTFRSGGEVCRASAGECDGTAETCTGTSGACPANVVASAGTPCTTDGNDCTTDECDGFGKCGTISGAGACDDGDACTTDDTCNGVVCTGGPPPNCDDGDPCTTDSCSAGACIHPNAPDGTSCDDGDVCTAADECESGICVAGAPACGTEVQIAGTKLVVVDKEEVAAKAKVVFVSKDAMITKGAGTDPATIGVDLDITYDAEDGGFTLDVGTSDGTAGWLVNKATVAKFVNKNAPGAPTEAKVAVIKPGKVLKLVGKGLGDRKLDILTAGAPSGDVTVVYAVDNGGELFRHCTAFGGCVYKPIAAGTGAKLVCKNGAPAVCPLPGSPSGAFVKQ